MTPTLNQGQFIDHTLQSIAKLTYQNIEHIVRDGGSTDATLEILRAREPQYPLRWQSEPDSGMYAAINDGFADARGEIHAYLNSDDLYFPWSIEVAVAYLQAHPEIDVVYGDAINVDDSTHREHVRVMPSFDLGRLVYVWPLPQPAAFWRAKVTTELGGFDATLKYVADWDFFIRAGRRFKIAKIDEFLAVERRHSASKTLGDSAQMQIETERMLARYQRALPGGQRARMQLRAYAARRVAWIRLLDAIRRRADTPGLPWARLIGAADVRVNPLRLAVGLLPWSPQEWKAGSVSTGVDWLTPR